MSDQDKKGTTMDAFDEEYAFVSREVRNFIKPVRLGRKETIKFRCYPGISCFNACCKDIDIILTPYDMLRLRKRLDVTPEAFLYRYAKPSTLAKGQLPIALIKMDKETGICPFNTPEGCTVYDDRPVACRYYPVGMALMHKQAEEGHEDFHFLIKETFCKGHAEENLWTVGAWREDQGADVYDSQNNGWMEIIIKRRSAGDGVATGLPISEFFYMVSTNPPELRRFFFESSFFKRYEVAEETQEMMKDDDEALIEFGFAWLKSVLFGDRHVKVREDAIKEAEARRKIREVEIKAELKRRIDAEAAKAEKKDDK
ncbi:MAG: YkgJ family cysteine cluster protein [Magnetococcales bacterium]|nr:YkgJ family cysteine cluster protein [Magnetococcales bacterium]